MALPEQLKGRVQPVPYDKDGIPMVMDDDSAPLQLDNNPAAQVQQGPAFSQPNPMDTLVTQTRRKQKTMIAPQVPEAPPEPAAAAPVVPQRNPVTDNKNLQHPLLKKLLDKFGISKKDYPEIEIYLDKEKIVLKMSALSEELSIWCFSQAQQKALTDHDGTADYWYKMFLASCAVIALNNEPVYKILGLSPSPEENKEILDSKDPLFIPSSVRKITGALLLDLFWKRTSGIGDKLYAFYESKILNAQQIETSMDTENNNKFRYACPEENCMEVIFETPVLDEEGFDKPFYCRYHGRILEKGFSLAKEKSLPLA